MFHKFLADGFFVLATIALIAAMYGWQLEDLWLASTQWVLVSNSLLLMGIYIRMSRDDDEDILRSRRINNKKRRKK